MKCFTLALICLSVISNVKTTTVTSNGKVNPTCPKNQVYSECGANICQNTCANPKKSMTCKGTCIAGCICPEGYLRNDQNICVLPVDCTNGCGGDPNAFFDPCGDPCPKTCNNKDKGLMCKASCLVGGGCKCKPGYFRNFANRCIKESECPQCGENEFFDCGSACDTTCATLGEICPIINIKCNEMCYCIDGYARDENNKCIPIKQCPPKKCPANQTWVPCPRPCPPEETCDMYISGIVYDCAKPIDEEDSVRKCTGICQCSSGFVRKIPGGDCIKPETCCDDPNAEVVECPNPCPGGTCENPQFADCKAPCKYRGCQCKKGYVKNANGKCILQSECPKICGRNEVWNPCTGYCTFDDTCEWLMEGIVPDCAAPPDDWQCPARCECPKGFVRIGEDCLEQSACCADPNAEFVQCPNPCPGGTCDQPEFTPCKMMCKPWGCQCKKGFVKDSNGKCVPLSQCRCADPNAEMVQCPNPCPGGTCDQPEFNPCKAPCKAWGCQCKKGYVKDSKGKCIPLSQCLCGNNEVWNPCAKWCTFDDTCEKLMNGWFWECTTPSPSWQCTGRCECAPGYVRITGSCVLPSACCADPNAEFIKCPNPCPGGTCVQPEFTPCKMKCQPWGCQCKKGFVKDINGKCILLSKCPKCGLNEFFDCGSACDTTCATLGEPCNIINKKCVEQCYCVKGYARNKNNVCVPIKECPPKFTCGMNEEYAACPSPCPPEKSCDSLFSGLEPLCPVLLNPPTCTPACRCKSGYVRNNQKKCVLPAGCCTDPNSQLVDNPNCCPGGTCASPSFLPCKRLCPRKGCQCKPGFLKKSDMDVTCISKNKCPTIKPTKPIIITEDI